MNKKKYLKVDLRRLFKRKCHANVWRSEAKSAHQPNAFVNGSLSQPHFEKTFKKCFVEKNGIRGPSNSEK